MADLEAEIDALWDRRDEIDVDDPDVQRPIREAVALLDAGEARVAEWVDDGDVVVNQWLKRAILLLFKISKMETI
ncbi:2,3,4,5-tetrahydropyridine-2,6-dicarboxylate N-succinyltransferase, partial [cyanobacterium TDX16]